MFCYKCGYKLEESLKFCPKCGTALVETAPIQQPPPLKTLETPPPPPAPPMSQQPLRQGYSSLINDPTFETYRRSTMKLGFRFALVAAVIAIIGFSIYGETSSDMDNPEAFFVGLAIGGMFLVIALVQRVKGHTSRTWDGQVVDKKIKKKQEKVNFGDEYRMEQVILYTVVIQEQNGKKHKLQTRNIKTTYDYYRIGDQLRHHKGLNTYEKYDKSHDNIIFCNACGTVNDIEENLCSICHCPLLK